LERCLKEVIITSKVNEKEKDPDLKFRHEGYSCKTFVITTSLQENSPKPTILRSYDISRDGRHGAFEGTVWEAGRATSAAPTFFGPINVSIDTSMRECSDGATIANNPSYAGIMEASRLWDPADIDLVVSLGTGPEPQHTLAKAMEQVIGSQGLWLSQRLLTQSMLFRFQLACYSLHALTSTTRVHHQTADMVEAFGRSRDSTAEVYFRLNVADEDALVPLDAHDKKMEDPLIRLANEYMEKNALARVYKIAIASILTNQLLDAGFWEHVKRLNKMFEPAFKISVLENKFAMAQFDTSQKNNFATLKCLNKLELSSTKFKDGRIARFIAIDGIEKKSDQVVTLHIRLDGYLGETEFYIVEDLGPELGCEIILGSDFKSVEQVRNAQRNNYFLFEKCTRLNCQNAAMEVGHFCAVHTCSVAGCADMRLEEGKFCPHHDMAVMMSKLLDAQGRFQSKSQ
jgi:hypothetical protein